jgi:alkylated DNA repair dioxygenase AlkB
MSNTCSIQLTADKLPKIFNKIEFFLFRALEQKGMDFYKISQQPKTAESMEVLKDIKTGKITKEKLESIVGKKYTQVLLAATSIQGLNYVGTEAYKIAQMVHLLDTVKNSLIPSYVNDYIENAKILREEGSEEGAKDYEVFAANLQNLIVMWEQIAPNFLSSSEIFSTKTKFKMDENGLVDLNDVADDEEKMLKKMVFDKPSNEVDPIDDVDKAVELFLRSIHVEDGLDSDYGYTVNVDYNSFIKSLFNDLQDSISLGEIIKKLEQNVEKVPEYQQIINKLKLKPNEQPTTEQTQFRINFVNSFAKAFVPIMITSIERSNGFLSFKVLEAATGKRSLYDKIIESNFTSRGMRVNDGEKEINLAHQVNGVWMLTKEDLPKIKDFLDASKLTAFEFSKRRVEFLKGLGFEFSPKTEKYFINTTYLIDKFDFIYNHLIKSIELNPYITDPIKTIKQNVKNLPDTEKGNKRWFGQNNNLNDIAAEELKNNTSYNMEKSVITAEGTRMHAIQLHNNITILNKFFSDANEYPNLESILKEPSMFWLDPRTNPNVRGSYYLNSLFYFDPAHPKFGKRRKVKKTGSKTFEYSDAKDAEPVKLTIVNTGGLQLKILDDFEKKGTSSTGLNELDKILQDMHGFFAMKFGYTGVLRLGDKSTDLGIGINYGYDPVTKSPINYGKPLGEELLKAIGLGVFRHSQFTTNVKNSITDYLKMRYLGEKGFFNSQDGDSGLDMGSKNFKNWSYFEDILKPETKKILDDYIKSLVDDPNSDVDNIDSGMSEYNDILNKDIADYFENTANNFYNKINSIVNKYGVSEYSLIGRSKLKENVYNYIANTFITDLDQMKIFFGDSMFFKAFHKRASKDSATGIFAMMDDELIDDLNDSSNGQGYGANTNLSAKKLIERTYENKIAELEENKKLSDKQKKALKKQYKKERDEALLKQTVSKSFKSAVLNDVIFNSQESDNILNNIEKLLASGKLYISDEMKKLYEESIKDVISEKYKDGNEADGQGKCTFDFYRIMSIATSTWLPEQEEVYKKIVEYNHYDELAEETLNEEKKLEYIQKRDAVGYDPTEPVYFPPKKFQYSGPQNYTRTINTKEYNTYVPIFDKFSLQPLIPTVIKKGGVKTADWHLARKMEYNGIAYVKFESGTKTENPTNKDSYYSKYDKTNPSVREIAKFDTSFKFKSEQELFYRHFKEQVNIDAEIHENTIFGSQIRKLILMNLDKPEFKGMKEKYGKYLSELAELEKVTLYKEMGIVKENGKLKVANFKKIVDYFLNEISKKNQDINVKKALNYNEETGKFDIPLDAATQSQVLEGIIISAINNKVVRYKTNGSMLIQMSVTGSEGVKFNKDASAKALETYGDSELKYYDIVEGKNGNPTTSKMDVKIALTGQWLSLLNLTGIDGRKIGTIERLNDSLNNDGWRNAHEKQLTMIAYRIPTQGRNFLDVMFVKEFLPAAVGDAIIMPKECVIKSGSDFDIDKMFVFYPNLTEEGNYSEGTYSENDLKNPDKYQQLKKIIQNKLYESMAEIILHPANYMELVTPSINFHIMPILDAIFEKLGIKEEGKDRPKTDFKNTKILERENNYKKFLSLLKGKSDLGIAAVANTFNTMFQLSNASSNRGFLTSNQIISFFDSADIKKRGIAVEKIDFSNKFDEDGMLKSEFFSEFINAFVDVANDDYVFAANIVTELSPVMFYMKYAGMSSKKILNFMNQPAIREYTKNLAVFQNNFVKLGNTSEDSVRQQALEKTLLDLGYSDINSTGKVDRNTIGNYIGSKMDKVGVTDLFKYFTDDMLLKGVRKEGYELTGDKDGTIKPLSEKGKLIQVAMLLEFENLRLQSNSVSKAQKFLNFDTSPYSSSFDVYLREQEYNSAIKGNSCILNADSLKYIKNNSMISSLDVGSDIREILAALFPVRNDKVFNETLSKQMETLSAAGVLLTQDNMLKFARTAKNDYINYILQNNIEKSKEGMEFFHETFDTTKGFNEYLAELVETNKLVDMWNGVKDMTAIDNDGNEYKVFDLISSSDQFPFVKNIINIIGANNANIKGFNIIQSSSNQIEKNSIIVQFDELCKLTDPTNKPIRDFFRNLALYSIFQSGLNTSDISYTSVTPVNIVNKLYGFATEERNKTYSKLSEEQKIEAFGAFYRMFAQNNPTLYNSKNSKDEDLKRASTATPTFETSSRGKWYSENVKLNVKKWEFGNVITPVVTNVTAKPTGGVKVISPADVDAYNTYLQKSNGKAPKEFFTNATTFKEFYNPASGKREKAPQSSKWLLQDNGLYNLVDKDGGEVYITDVNLKTGIKIVAPAQPSTSVQKFDKKNLFTVTPIQAADKKAKIKASISTQYIGFGEGITGSSTETYRQQAGDLANTGNYSANDVIFVSVPGARGNALTRAYKQDRTIKEAIKAIEAGATILVDNKAYTEKSTYNEGEKRLLKNLEAKGYTYSEITVDGQLIGTWSKSTQPSTSGDEFTLADKLTPIEQNFADGTGGRQMQPQFKGKSTMDLIISGDRTRTTRAKTDIQRMAKDYNLSKISDLVGKVIRMTDKTGRQVYTRITKVTPFTQEYQDATWQKEGWVKSVTDKHVGDYPYAIEFEVVNKPTQPSTNNIELSNVKPAVGTIQAREQIQPGFFNYGKLSNQDEKTILDEAIKQTNEQGYPVKKAVVYAHWGNMWAVTDKGADAFPVFGKHLKRSEESAGLGKGLKKIDLPRSTIQHNDGGKGWYDYYPTDQNGEKLAPIPQVIKDILQKQLGIDMSVYDSAIINSYGETTELSRHVDNTEDKGNAYKIPIVSISLLGDSIFQYSEPSTNPNNSLSDKNKVNLAPGQVVVFGGPSRAMAHRVLNGKSGNALDIKNSVDSLRTERINITLRRALFLSEQEYNKWVENNKKLKESSQKEQKPSEMNIETKIDNWIEKELPWSISTPISEIASMYENEKLSGESIEEFLNRLSCNGKLI